MKHRRPCADPLEILPAALRKIYSFWLSQFYPFASIGRNVSFHFTSRVHRPRAPRISLGNSVSLKEYVWLNPATDDPTGKPTIIVGDNCHIGFGSIISAKNQILLERNVLVGQMVIVVDHNHTYEDVTAPILDQGINGGGTIRICEGTWIGHGAAIICPRGELTIGRNCVVAANSLVMRSIPDYSVVSGNPATIVRQYDPERQAWRIGGRESGPERKAEIAPQLSSVAQGNG